MTPGDLLMSHQASPAGLANYLNENYLNTEDNLPFSFTLHKYYMVMKWRYLFMKAREYSAAPDSATELGAPGRLEGWRAWTKIIFSSKYG